MPSVIRIGTRQSPLALWQAEFVSEGLRKAGHQVELVRITTQGDVLQGSLAQAGGTGLFTKEIQRALLDGRCDLAVHSLKDLPTVPIEGLCLAGVPKRENPADCLVSKHYPSWEQLPHNARLGTGSPRRRAQLKHLREDLQLLDIRGNLDTRLKKLDAGDYDAIILAYAGMHRLGLDARMTQILDVEVMMPAVGQAALGLETRLDDVNTRNAVQSLDDPETHSCVLAERGVLRQLNAGCLAPVAVLAKLVDGSLTMRCKVYSQDYREFADVRAAVPWPEVDGIDHGAINGLVKSIIAQLRQQNALRWIDESARLG